MIKAIVYGAVAGAIFLFLLSLCLSWLAHFTIDTAATDWLRAKQVLPRKALIGAVLGSNTASAWAAWRANTYAKARRICIVGGSLMALALIGEIAYWMWSISNLTRTTFVFFGPLLGPDRIPWQVRFLFMSLLLNSPLQWSILLALTGIWLPKSKPTAG